MSHAIGRDRAAWPHNPNHLGDAFGRLGNEENHQRHNGAIEPAVGEGQYCGVTPAELRQACRGTRAGKGKLRLGRIDPLNLGRRAALHQIRDPAGRSGSPLGNTRQTLS